jgi:hypothetical protein
MFEVSFMLPTIAVPVKTTPEPDVAVAETGLERNVSQGEQ